MLGLFPETIQQVNFNLGWEFYSIIGLFFVLYILGIPIWAVLGVTAVLMLELANSLDPGLIIGEDLFLALNKVPLTAIPLFILTGDVLVRTGISRKFLNIAEALTCWAKGGFGSATVLVCGMFSSISGSDAAGAAAVGRMTINRLVESGYPRPYACALVAAGACTGILIPPSIAYIIIGLTLGVDVSALFIAALVPGLLVLLTILITNSVINYRYAYETGNVLGFSEWASNLGRTIADGWYAFLVPAIIFGGIFSGQFTPTEAGAAAVVVTVIMGFILRTLKWSDFPSMLLSSAKVNGVILPIIAFSVPLASALAVLDVPQAVVYGISQLTENYVLIVLLIIAMLIVAGCVMEATPNIVILAPLLWPLAQDIGMNQIHFCILMITSLGVGFITPPLGLNLFVVAGLTKVSILAIAARAVPYVFTMLLVVLLIAFVPAISTDPWGGLWRALSSLWT